jgi:phosphoribosylformylglycinamidine cyclo-ligase
MIRICLVKRYVQAGVNINAGDDFVKRIKEKVASTFSDAVLADIGAFGGFFDAKFGKMQDPVLVSSVDGVGTKLKVAFLLDKHDTIGQDLVNHCVNDIAVCGAQPLFFLDYFATGKLKPQVAESVVTGMVKACRENGCSLIGGETAEMPGFYRDDEYDIAGTIVGVAERKKIFDGKKVKVGDVLIGLPSNGLHTNGYSLAREVLFERYEIDDYIDELGTTIGAALLMIHRSYLGAIRLIASMSEVHAFAHITGGGIVGNTKRVIPSGCSLKIDWSRWERPVLFRVIQKTGNVPEDEMRKVFNLGVGVVIIASKRGVEKIMETLREANEAPFIIGEVVHDQDHIHNPKRTH